MKIFYFYFTLDILLCATILNCLISHFRVPKALTFKTRLSANTIFVQMRFFLHENKNRFHINGFALSLALKQRLGKFRNCSEAYIRTLVLHRTILSFAEVQPSQHIF